jgi:hypothetical protein
VSARADTLHHVSDSLSLTSLEAAGAAIGPAQSDAERETDMKTTLCLEVEFNPEVTDAESLASAFGTLVDNALSTPGILGDPWRGMASGHALDWP